MGGNNQKQEPCTYLQGYQEEVNARLEEGDIRFGELRDKMNLLLEMHGETAEKVIKTAEIVSAWNNVKGFVNTVHTISKVLRWATLTGAAIAAIWYFVANGHWPAK